MPLQHTTTPQLAQLSSTGSGGYTGPTTRHNRPESNLTSGIDSGGRSSGSLITDIFSCFTLIIVSCSHLGQNSGKFSSTVSPRILTRVLLPQTGHNIHSYLHTLPSLYLMFLLTPIILMPANIKLLSVCRRASQPDMRRSVSLSTTRAQPKYHCRQAAPRVGSASLRRWM